MLVSGHCAHYGRKPPVQPVIRWARPLVACMGVRKCGVRKVTGGPKGAGVRSWSSSGHVGTSIVHAEPPSAGPLRAARVYAVAASAGGAHRADPGRPLVAAVGEGLRPRPAAEAGRGRPGMASPNCRPVRQAPGSASSTTAPARFSAELGVAARRPDRGPSPRATWTRDYIHLGHRAAGPAADLAGVPARVRLPGRTSRPDMFEHYVATYPTASREVVCDSVEPDLHEPGPNTTACTGTPSFRCPRHHSSFKRGPFGARLIVDGHPQEVEGPPVAQLVDPTGGGEGPGRPSSSPLRADGLPERPGRCGTRSAGRVQLRRRTTVSSARA